jgi:hypothetical protein
MRQGAAASRDTERAMSQENVEVVRKAFEAWVVRGLEEWPEPGPFVGRDAVMRWFEQLRETTMELRE